MFGAVGIYKDSFKIWVNHLYRGILNDIFDGCACTAISVFGVNCDNYKISLTGVSSRGSEQVI